MAQRFRLDFITSLPRGLSIMKARFASTLPALLGCAADDLLMSEVGGFPYSLPQKFLCGFAHRMALRFSMAEVFLDDLSVCASMLAR